MCGIAGYFCTNDYDPRLAVAVPLLGVYMRERGKHSWGITNGTDVEKFKGDFVDSYAGQLSGSKQLLLHTRFGTTGELTAENSHPFLIKGILGVHNGQVYNHKKIAEKHAIEYKVDSEVIYHRLADGGDLSEIEAYGALVFFQDGIIHIGKFNAGQMVLVKTDFGWLWASTMEAVNHSLLMSGLRHTAQFDVDMKEGRLYKLIGDRVVKDARKLDFAKQTYTPTSSSSTIGTPHGTYGAWDDKRYSSPTVRRTWDNSIQMFRGEDGNIYERYYDNDPYKAPLPYERYHDNDPYKAPLPTAETTTFTAEPGSDYDDVVDTADKDDPTEQYENEGSGCNFCHRPFRNGEHILIGHDKVCATCYREFTQMDEPDVMPSSTSVKYDIFTADEVTDVYHDSDLLQCRDCRNWSMGDETLYVEESGMFSLCEFCFEKYEDAEEEDDTSQCGTSETRGEATIRCVKRRGHSDDCIDYQGRTIGNSQTGVEDARADEEARESAPQPF